MSSPSTPLSDIINYLENKGYKPEYGNSKTRFRHPEKSSRLVTVVRTGSFNMPPTLFFTNPLRHFAFKWQLSSKGELPQGHSVTEIHSALDDFFSVSAKNPPTGAAPFEQRLKELNDIIKRIALRRAVPGHYALNYEELLALGQIKAHEIWKIYGDKPTHDFQSLFAKSYERKIYSLLNAHFISKRRAGAETVSFSTEMAEVLPEEQIVNRLSQAEREEYLEKLSPAQQALLRSIFDPPPGLLRQLQLDLLRYAHVKAQRPRSRLPEPTTRLAKIAHHYGLPIESLQEALAEIKAVSLARGFPLEDWATLIKER